MPNGNIILGIKNGDTGMSLLEIKDLYIFLSKI